MNNNLEQLKDTRKVLEELYSLYTTEEGELIGIEELNAMIYKGKKLHADQDQIWIKKEEGIIKISGEDENKRSLYLSFIRLFNPEKEVRFCDLQSDSEEQIFLEETKASINDLISSKNTKKGRI